MKAVMLSIRPEWCEKILSGQKTVEIRKTRPKLETPFKCYIYMTRGCASYPVTLSGVPYICHDCGGQHVIAEFTCDTIITDKTFGHDAMLNAAACMEEAEAAEYSSGKVLYGWHISDLRVYEEPKKSREFKKPCDENGCANCKNKIGTSIYGLPMCNQKNLAINVPPQSWCYVEEVEG